MLGNEASTEAEMVGELVELDYLQIGVMEAGDGEQGRSTCM
jgi:hypothetical protein